MARVSTDEAELQTVVERERLLLRADVRADAARVEQLLHPDFLEFGASGRSWHRAAIVDSLAADPTTSGVATGFAPVRLADDVVLLTYRVDGDPGSLRSSVWLRNGTAGWRLRFHQGTRSGAVDGSSQ
jgi:ribonuclease HI